MNIGDIIVSLFAGLAFGLLIGGGCVSKGFKNNAVIRGHAEYYISTNNFSKEWRWKEIK